MPRPKRPKVIHTVPSSRGPKSPATSSTQHQLRNLSPASSGRVTNATDDSDGLVTTQKTATGSRKVAAGGDFTMTGALGAGEVGEARLRPPSKRTVEEVTRIAREAEYAGIAADRRKAREVAARQSNEQIQIPSTFQFDAGSRPGSKVGNSAIQSRRPSIVSRGQQTPMAHSSALGAAMFKKRPRQPSLLQMVQSSQTAQSEIADDDEDLYDFRPDDESTPLVKSQTQSHALTSSSSRQTSGSRKRKMATPELQVPASQSECIPSSPSAVLSQPFAQQEGSDQQEEETTAEPILPTLPAAQTPAPEIFSDTLAPPQSSSSPPPDNSKRTTARRAAAQRAPASKSDRRHPPNRSASSRPPHTTTSKTSSPVRQPLRPLTTATLQNLLPRRRTRQRPQKGAYDFPSSSELDVDTTILGEDEDELSFQAGSRQRRKAKTPARSMQPTVMTGNAMTRVKAKAIQSPKTNEKGKRVSRTYTRKSLAEAEAGSGVEEDDEDDSLGPASLNKHGKGKEDGQFDGNAKKEMERLAAKFAEVDDYALDFEDMTGSSSQMADAR